VKIATILDQIDLGSMALPEFQRGYVWNRDQVRGLMLSMYKKHPVGSLLVWVTQTESAAARGDGPLSPGFVKLLLDGQQRITSLYGIIRGKPPKFFDGNAQTFTGLHFDLENEVFEFYAPAKMKDNPLWISVTDLMQLGAGKVMEGLLKVPELAANVTTYLTRVTAIDSIKQIDLHIEEVAGEEKTVDVVVDIFNRVNSGGTKLSKGDLALAKICAEWPDARAQMKARLAKWRNAGFHFRLDWILRVINANLTGEALFSALKDVTTEQFRTSLEQSEQRVDRLLNTIASRLGLDHDRVLGSRGAIPLMARYLTQRGGKLTDPKEIDKLLYWYVHTLLWGRYSAQVESTLNRDLELIEDATPAGPGKSLDELIAELRTNRGDLRLTDEDFRGSTIGNRFYPLLYLMTRVCHARDWETDDELTAHLLGHLSSLQVHHIFPKSLLYKHGYSRREVNAIANFTFLTQETNLAVSNKDPAKYIPAYEKQNPGVIASHWIPMDSELWKIENYLDFLAERRKLLAKAANEFLDKLCAGTVPPPPDVSVLERPAVQPVGGIAGEDEQQVLEDINAWVVEQGLPEGEVSLELIDESGQVVGYLDLAWPNGLQEGLSQPVALLIDEGAETEDAANQAGYRFFTEADSFRSYVEREVLALCEST
jgi:hypothetical protein